MNKFIVQFSFFGLIAGLFLLGSCKREELDTETVSTTDNALCESEFLRIFPEANGIAIGEEGVQRVVPGFSVFSVCPNDSVNPADTLDGFPVTLFLDFGTGCVGNDGKTRKGMIRCIFMNPYDGADDTVNISLDNYYVNDIHYEGTVQVIRSTNSFTQTVSNGRCTKSGWEILWSSTRTCTWVSGQNTPSDPNDDIFEFTGNASGTNREGKTFDVTITSPLVRGKHCAYITKGTLDITPEGKKTRTVDFGNGACDNKATLTINGNTFQFNLQ
ncbi:MAG: hypothetical protein IT233_06990 [Bacteroidia bacterium]|nr:hypothetical protein [Bacteroidia bacterium]